MFREFESVDVCGHIPPDVGPVVVKIVVNLFSRSSLRVSEVQPRGFVLLISAVQSQSTIIPSFTVVQNHLQNPAFVSGSICICSPLFVWVGVLLV
jgi:hypothetical protein